MSAPGPAPASEERRSMFGVTLFLVSLGVFFAALFVLYFWLRADMESWPPPGEPALPMLLPALNTAVVVASSVVIQLAVLALERAHPQRFARLILLTANLGALFLVLQVLLFRQAVSMGIAVGQSLYAGILYTLAGVHALHMLVGVAAVIGLSLAAYRRSTTARARNRARMWAAYWHFVGGVWVLMFVALFVA